MPNRLVGTDLDFQSTSRLKNVPQATAPGEVVTFEQLNSSIEGLAWKDAVRAASTVNITLTAPGATVDGVTMVTGDRFLAKDQTTTNQNGLYVWNGAASTATRTLDGSTFTELEAAVVVVEEGTANGGTSWRQSAVNGTIDTDAVTFGPFGTVVPLATETTSGRAEIATQAEVDAGVDDLAFITALKLATWSGRIRRAAGNFGDGASTVYIFTHNLGTRDVVVNLYNNSTYSDPICEIVRSTVNYVSVGISPAPSSNAMRAVVIG